MKLINGDQMESELAEMLSGGESMVVMVLPEHERIYDLDLDDSGQFLVLTSEMVEDGDIDEERMFIFEHPNIKGEIYLGVGKALVLPMVVEGTPAPCMLFEDGENLEELHAYFGRLLKQGKPLTEGAKNLAGELGLEQLAEGKVYPALTRRFDLPAGEDASGRGETDIDWGTVLISKEAEPNRAYSFFKSMVRAGANGSVLTRTHPDKARKSYDIDNEVNIFWLSKTKDDFGLSPTNIGKLAFNINNYVKNTMNSVILLDGLEYLINNNNFPKIIRWLDDIQESIVLTNSILILPVLPEGLDPKELTLLEKRKGVLPEPDPQQVDTLLKNAPGVKGTNMDTESQIEEEVEDASDEVKWGHPSIIMEDEKGRGIPGVKVEARVGGRRYTAIADSSGKAEFQGLTGKTFPQGVRFFASREGYDALLWDAGILDSETRHVLRRQDLDEMVKEAESANENNEYNRAMRLLRLIHRHDENNAKYYFYKKHWRNEIRNSLKGVGSDQECETCGGSGECNACSGLGKCQECEGGDCPQCGGTGAAEEGPCPECQGTGECGSCQGTGMCSRCQGSGKCGQCVLPRSTRRCTICDYEYRPWDGAPESGVQMWTLFESIPEDWRCPECGAKKDMFED